MTTWPAVVWSAPALRGLDEAARAALAAAGRLVELAAGAALYSDGDASESFFVVASGRVELHAVRRGDAMPALLRAARPGDSLGEEALLPGLPRRATATAAEDAQLAQVPIAVFRRLAARAGGAAAGREQRYLERAATRDLLACSAFARDLAGADIELLLDAARLDVIPRGTRIYEAGAPAESVYLVVDGLVQLQRPDGHAVTAYLARGDFFGDQEALAGEPRRDAAVAAGDSWCAVVPREVLRTLSDRNPGLLARLRRVANEHGAAQAEAIAEAGPHATQHVFRDLYRLHIARSLLVIDQDTCVRCGHCAWACEDVHGTSRLIRRGDKVVAQLAGSGAATLLLPNTCQHCRHAACMIDCPTGAIGRDPEGEVFIRPSQCTGCGNCAKACPWENIQLAPRPGPAAPELSPEIAVKCDLCRGFEGPACVDACPTGAVLRVDPSRDVTDVARILGLPVATGHARRAPAPTGSATVRASDKGLVRASSGHAPSSHARQDVDVRTPDRRALSSVGDVQIPARRLANEDAGVPAPLADASSDVRVRGPDGVRRARLPRSTAALAGATATGLAIVATAGAWSMHGARGWTPAHGIGFAAGVAAAVLVAALAAYVVPKRRVRPRPVQRLSPARAIVTTHRGDPTARRESAPAATARATPRATPSRTTTHRRSRTRVHFLVHLGLGALVPAAVLAHAGAALRATPGGAAAAALGVTVALGVLAAAAYRLIPRALTRIERRGTLPEDLAGEREALEARLYAVVTGKTDRTKALADHVILPYARARLGPVALVASSRTLAEERAHLRERIAASLGGRTVDAMDELIEIAVELRALPARRALSWLLRVWPPIHAIAGATTVALLVVHVALAVAR